MINFYIQLIQSESVNPRILLSRKQYQKGLLHVSQISSLYLYVSKNHIHLTEMHISLYRLWVKRDQVQHNNHQKQRQSCLSPEIWKDSVEREQDSCDKEHRDCQNHEHFSFGCDPLEESREQWPQERKERHNQHCVGQ